MKYIVLILMAFLFIAGCGGPNRYEYTGVLEGTVVKVPALTGGEITDILVEEGQTVQEKQTLAIIDTTDLMLQRLQLSAQLEELLIQTEIAQTQLERTEKDLTYTQEKFERISSLYRKNSIPRQNLDDIENQLQQVTTANITALQQVRALRIKAKQLNTQHQQIEKRIADATISAPLPGIVSSIYFEPGEAIPPFGSLLEITSIREMETQIYIDEELLTQIRHGQEVHISVDGLDSSLTGNISWISPKAEFTPKTILTPETRTSLVYAVKVKIENMQRILKHGMPVVITL